MGGKEKVVLKKRAFRKVSRGKNRKELYIARPSVVPR